MKIKILFVDKPEKSLLEQIKEKPRCTTLRHHVNFGKGRALKDGLTTF